MDLYFFGFGTNYSFPSINYFSYLPRSVLHATNIRILWASWCDIVYAKPNEWSQSQDTDSDEQDQEEWTIHYDGTSLEPNQIDLIRALEYNEDHPPLFFGRELDRGLMGFVDHTKQTLTLFHGLSWNGYNCCCPGFECFRLNHETWEILDIQFTGTDGALISTRAKACRTLSGGYVVDMPDLGRFLNGLRDIGQFEDMQHPLFNCERCDFSPSQFCTNITGFTALNEEGKVYTYTHDRRFPKCLGRPTVLPIGPHRRDCAFPIRYFEETKISKIASGGFYSAAITEDGELYVWGQTDPRVCLELEVLGPPQDEYDDEFVRCVALEIDGKPAIATDVAIGNGHILVAAEVRHADGRLDTAVFAAGLNDKGQLGLGQNLFLDFSCTFLEVKAFRGKTIKQMVCAGWSSFVVVEAKGILSPD